TGQLAVLRMTRLGDVYFARDAVLRNVNLTGGQMLFPATQVPSTDPNMLDDYREGTWTPSIGGDGGYSGQTYGTRLGSYVKVGRQVTASFHCALSLKGTMSGAVAIFGLPFAAGSNTPTTCSFLFQNLATTWTSMVLYLPSSGGLLYLQGCRTAQTHNVQTATLADLTDTTTFIGSVTYLTTN